MPEPLSTWNWLEAAFDALATAGVEAVRVEPLAAALGVTKGSFYHHFDSRRALHLAVLAAWEERGTTQVIDDVDRNLGDAGARVRRLAHSAMRDDPRSDAIENAIRTWAVADATVAEVVQRVDDRRLAYVRDLLREHGQTAHQAKRRANLLYRVLIGEFTWRAAGGPSATDREIDDTIDLILAD